MGGLTRWSRDNLARDQNGSDYMTSEVGGTERERKKEKEGDDCIACGDKGGRMRGRKLPPVSRD